MLKIKTIISKGIKILTMTQVKVQALTTTIWTTVIHKMVVPVWIIAVIWTAVWTVTREKLKRALNFQNFPYQPALIPRI